MNTGHRAEVKPLLLPPRLRTLEDGAGRRASYLELFFDLVFVVAIAQLAHELVISHSLRGFFVFAALYLPVFLAWQGFSFYADRFDTDDVLFRLVMFTAMLAIAALAIQIPDVAHGDSDGFVIAYVILRSLMAGLYMRSYRHVPAARPLRGRYVWQYSLAIGVWLLSLAFPPPTRYVLWGIALAWELSIPTRARHLFAAIPVHGSHIPERFALFKWAQSAAVVASLGFVAAAAIWWVYFGSGAEVTMIPSPSAVIVFTHAHIPLLAALTAVSAGISLAIQGASAGSLDAGTRWALAGGAALYLVCVTATQRATLQGVLRGTELARTVAACALIVVALVGGAFDPALFTGLVAATLVLLVVYKLWSAQRLLRAGA